MLLQSKSRTRWVLCALVLALPLGAAAPFADQKALADSMEKKINLVRDNGARETPQKRTTTFTQDEINAYFAERRLKMPDGVRSVTFDLATERVTSRTRVDFDEITRERRSYNPLMYLFTGTHNVVVAAKARTVAPGRVRVTVESVEIDGVTVPKMALEFFVERFVNPKYPTVGLDRDYALPAKMKTVSIAARRGIAQQ